MFAPAAGIIPSAAFSKIFGKQPCIYATNKPPNCAADLLFLGSFFAEVMLLREVEDVLYVCV